MALSKIKSIYLGDGSVNDTELGHISTVTSNVQTQINNIDISTHTDPLTFDQESTPSNPTSNKHKLYFKNDGNLYKLDSAGNEKLVGGDPEGVKTNAADIFTNFVKDMENHGRDALHTETGFVDELETAGDMVDASASSGMTYTGTPNSTNGDNYYSNTPGATNQTADIQTYTTESHSQQQEWTNANTGASTGTFTNGSATVNLSSGTWPTNALNARISQDGTNWYDITTRNSNTQITLASNFGQSTVTGNWTIRMTEFSGGKVKLNDVSGTNLITETVSIAPAFAQLTDCSQWSAIDDMTSTETVNSQTIRHFVIHGPSGMTAYNDTDTVVSTFIPGVVADQTYPYTTEANYAQQEWTNANTSTSQITVGLSSVLDQSNANGNDVSDFGLSQKTWNAQGFSAGASGTLDKIKIDIKKNGNPTDNVQISIQADSGGDPSGTDLTSVETISGSSLTTSFVQKTVTFSSTTSVTSGTTYHLVVKRSGSNDGSNYYSLNRDGGSNYSSTLRVKRYDSGTWYNVSSTHDIDFETYVQQTTATISSGSFPTNALNARITLDAGTTWRDITARDSNTQLTLASYPSAGTYNWTMRMTEFDSGKVKLNSHSVTTTTSLSSDCKLLLHGDGSDASTTFTDSSASSHSCTAQGNAQIDTAQSVFGGSSMLFDGNGDYVSIADSSDWDLPNNSNWMWKFRLRFNALPTSSPDTDCIMGNGDDGYSGSNGWIIGWKANNLMFMWLNGGSNVSANFAWTPSTNTWYSICLSFDGSNIRAYVDGTKIGSDYSTYASGNPTHSNRALHIGYAQAGNASVRGYFDGWLDEIYFQKGGTVETGGSYTVETNGFGSVTTIDNVITEYVSTFPAFAQLKSLSGVSSINSAAVTDTEETGGHTITAAGNAKINTSGGGVGSTFLNGTSSFSFNHNYNFGASNTNSGNGYNEVGHTFYSGTNISHVGRVLWPIHKTGSPDSTKIRCRVWSLTGSGTSKTPDSLLGTSGEIESDVSSTSEGSPNNRQFDFPEPVALTANTWYGISIRFDYDESGSGSNYFRISVNSDSTGKSNIENGSGSDMNQFSDTNSNTGSGSDETWTTGQYSDKPLKSRIYDGFAVSPKFGTGMGKFDGTGDYISAPDSSDFDLTATNYTIDMWVFWNTRTNEDGVWSIYETSSNWQAVNLHSSANELRWCYKYGGGNIWNFSTSSSGIATGAWTHLAFVKNGSSVKIYVGGVEKGSATVSGTPTDIDADLTIGKDIPAHGTSGAFDGWMDEFRWSNNARWTAGFTPATSAYTTDSNTKLLLHMNGSNNSTTFTDNSFEEKGPYYAFVFGPSGMSAYNDTDTKVSIFNQTGSVWKQAIQYTSSGNKWQYNSNAEHTTTVTWTDATVNDINHALSQAVSTNAALSMTEADVEAITQAEMALAGGPFESSANNTKVGIAGVLRSSSVSQPLAIDETKVNTTSSSTWKKIAKYTGSAWQYNDDTAGTNAENWVNATVNDMNHAVSQAVNVSNSVAGDLDATKLTAMGNADWALSGGFNSGTTTKIGIGNILKSTSNSQNPEVDKIATQYDQAAAAIDLRTKQWTGSGGTPAAPGSAPGTIYLFVVDEQTSGTPTYAVTRNGGTNWTNVTFDASWTFSGSKTARRATIDVTGQGSGTDPRLKITNASNHSYKIHAIGLQTRS